MKEHIITTNEHIIIPSCSDFSLEIYGGGGGGAGALFDNLESDGTFFSAGGGGGGLGQYKHYSIKKIFRKQKIKILIGNGGMGGVGGTIAQNGAKGGKTSVNICGYKLFALGGDGGKKGINTKIGGSGGKYGAGGGGAYIIGGIGGKGNCYIPNGENGYSRANYYYDKNMYGGNGAYNDNSGTGITFVLNENNVSRVLRVGGGGSGAGINGGNGGSCGIPAGNGSNYGNGGGGGSGFNLDFPTGSNGGNGSNGVVIIRYIPKKYKKCTIKMTKVHHIKPESEQTYQIDGQSIKNNDPCPFFLNPVTYLGELNTIILPMEYISSFYALGYNYISIGAGGGGGCGIGGLGAGGGGGGGSGVKGITSPIKITDIGPVFVIIANIGKPGSNIFNTDGGPTKFNLTYVTNDFQVITTGTTLIGGKAGDSNNGGAGEYGGGGGSRAVGFDAPKGGTGSAYQGHPNGYDGDFSCSGNGGGTNVDDSNLCDKTQIPYGGIGANGSQELTGGGGGGLNGGNGGSSIGTDGKLGDGGGGAGNVGSATGGNGGPGFISLIFTKTTDINELSKAPNYVKYSKIIPLNQNK